MASGAHSFLAHVLFPPDPQKPGVQLRASSHKSNGVPFAIGSSHPPCVSAPASGHSGSRFGSVGASNRSAFNSIPTDESESSRTALPGFESTRASGRSVSTGVPTDEPESGRTALPGSESTRAPGRNVSTGVPTDEPESGRTALPGFASTVASGRCVSAFGSTVAPGRSVSSSVPADDSESSRTALAAVWRRDLCLGRKGNGVGTWEGEAYGVEVSRADLGG